MFDENGKSALDFVRMTENGPDFWAIEPTGHYPTDCERGREAAIDLHCQLHFKNAEPNLLGSIAQAIVAKGRYGPLEIGFFQQIAEAIVNQGRVVD